MLPLSALLNPAPPEPVRRIRLPLSPESSPAIDSGTEGTSPPDRSMIPKHKLPKDAAVFIKNKPKGIINFPPYENLDELSLHRARKFKVYPLGSIRDYSRHIPYNSGKRDFFEKTGRESFEVFQYVFRVPNDDIEYTVMWDYNVGLVRMTPFFKCFKYPKTTPAKMLNSNPGLKEITHSITGGSIMAQGYWMPYQCAKAVCATFCHDISGALIPIFGPDFPSLCKPVDTPGYSSMAIDSAIVLRSTREAESFRRFCSKTASPGFEPRGGMASNIITKRDRRVFRSDYDDDDDHGRHHPRHRPRKAYITTPESEDSPYTTDTERETSPRVDNAVIGRPRQLPRFMPSPIPRAIAPLRQVHANNIRKSSGWTPANASYPPDPLYPRTEHHVSGPDPRLSAIPRAATTAIMAQQLPTTPQKSGNTPRSHPYSVGHPFSHSQFHVEPRRHHQHQQQQHHHHHHHRRPGVSHRHASTAPSESVGRIFQGASQSPYTSIPRPHLPTLGRVEHNIPTSSSTTATSTTSANTTTTPEYPHHPASAPNPITSASKQVFAPWYKANAKPAEPPTSETPRAAGKSCPSPAAATTTRAPTTRPFPAASSAAPPPPPLLPPPPSPTAVARTTTASAAVSAAAVDKDKDKDAALLLNFSARGRAFRRREREQQGQESSEQDQDQDQDQEPSEARNTKGPAALDGPRNAVKDTDTDTDRDSYEYEYEYGGRDEGEDNEGDDDDDEGRQRRRRRCCRRDVRYYCYGTADVTAEVTASASASAGEKNAVSRVKRSRIRSI